MPNNFDAMNAGSDNRDASASADEDLHLKMIDAAPDSILLMQLDGTILLMNNAARLAAGLEPSDDELRTWFDVVPPNFMDEAKRCFDLAVGGEMSRFTLTTEIKGNVTYWDIVFSPVRANNGTVAFILSIGRDVTENHQLDNELAEASEREKLVSQEMQHRIKNLFSVVSVLITMAERETKKDGKPEQLAPLLKAKMSALARASEATYIESNIPTNLLPEAGVEHVDVQRLVNAILAPYVLQVRIDGPETVTPRQNVTTLTLFLHELATNSAKYGALGRDTGLIAVSWYDDAQQLKLTWVETGGPPVLSKPDSVGFGSAMIDRLISLAGGSIERIWSPEGLIAQLELPNGTGVEGD